MKEAASLLLGTAALIALVAVPYSLVFDALCVVEIEAYTIAGLLTVGFFVGAASLYLGAVLCSRYESRR